MKLIQGKKKQRISKCMPYSDAFIRFLDKGWETFEDLVDSGEITKYVYLGVKAIGEMHTAQIEVWEQKPAYTEFSMISTLVGAIGLLTPHQFVQTFPADKKYDGEKYSTKDYFSSMKAIRTLDPSKPIGDEDAVLNLLWDYQNWNINWFMVEWMSALSRVCRLQGLTAPIDEFVQDLGVTTYTLYEEEGYIYNNSTGEVSKIQKPKAKKPSIGTCSNMNKL